MKRFKIIYFIFIIITFTQCINDYDLPIDTDIEISAGFLTPLAHGSLSFNDIISKFDSSGFIDTDADGLLFITYADSLFSFRANDLLEIPSQDFIQFFIESDFTIPPGWGVGQTVIIDSTQTFPFSFSQGEELDSMILAEGEMVFGVTSQFSIPATVVMTCPTIRNSNGPFTDTIVLGPNASANPRAPLDGYTISLSDSVTVDSTYKYIPVDFHVELTNNGAGITAGDDIEIIASIENIVFEAIFGYIGDYELVSENGELPLGFFDNAPDGTIQFEDPIINLKIGNSYGVPTAISINRFTGFKTDVDSIQLTFDSTIDTFGYAYPRLSDYINSDVVKDTTISINRTNSNISDFLSFLPSSIAYSLSAQSNPPGTDSSNFVLDVSEINIDLEFILPLWFKADILAFQDTMEMDFFEDADFIDKVTMDVDVSNGLPLDIDFQVYFLDSAYNHVDTLFFEGDTPIIGSGNVDPTTNIVTSPETTFTKVEILSDRFANLEKVRHGIISVGLKTPSDGAGDLMAVKFFADYAVEFKLGVTIDVKANSNDF